MSPGGLLDSKVFNDDDDDHGDATVRIPTPNGLKPEDRGFDVCNATTTTTITNHL